MDAKRSNEITLLNNQIIILDAWNNWKKKTEASYAQRIDEAKTRVQELTLESAELKKKVSGLNYGKSIGALILIILQAAFYALPNFVDAIKPYAGYITMATVLFVIPYIFWAKGSKKSFIAHILYWISNGVPFGVNLYLISRKDGQPNLYYALFENPKYFDLNHYYLYLASGSIIILIISMIIRSIQIKNKKANASKALFEREADVKEAELMVETLINEKSDLIAKKEKEYFTKYPVVLPSFSIPEVQKLLQYMINHRADTIKEAINAQKHDEALQNIQDDVRALREMQQKTNEDINEIRKNQENQKVYTDDPDSEKIDENKKEDLIY